MKNNGGVAVKGEAVASLKNIVDCTWKAIKYCLPKRRLFRFILPRLIDWNMQE
jgi:hypothetical protein